MTVPAPILLAALLASPHVEPSPARDERPPDVVSPEGLVVEPGGGLLRIAIPREEELVYGVVLDLGVLGEPRVGRVTLTSGVDEIPAGLPDPGEGKVDRLEVGWIKSLAKGSHFGYELEHELTVRVLPQDWPRFLYHDVQRGSSNREREIKIGTQGDRHLSTYKRDGHCKGCDRPEHFVRGRFLWEDDAHCKKCKRAEHQVWREPVTREIPIGTVDMLSAVYLARTMMRDGLTQTRFDLIDRDELWEVTLLRGVQRTVETPAGKFLAQEIKLLPRRAPGEPVEEDERFEGLFGIHGTIRIWLEASSGVPVRIAGEIPAGPLNLDVRVELASFRGTPEGFGPVE